MPLFLLSAFCFLLSASALALSPDDLALICNNQVPGSVELAQFYAQQQGVPANHIIELALPTGEQISQERFDPDVIKPIRAALLERSLRSRVKCLVTFYGVPLKVGPRNNKPEEAAELKACQEDADRLAKEITATITSLEAVVTRYDNSFKPASAVEMPQMLKRGETALQRAQTTLRQTADATAMRQLQEAIVNTLAKLGGPAALVRNGKPSLLQYLTVPPAEGPLADTQAIWDRIFREVRDANTQFPPLLQRRWDAAARKQARELAAKTFGLVDSLRLSEIDADYLSSDGTNAFDSELALLWFDNYTHKGPLPNPLYYRNPDRANSPAVMVMRLDGPQSGTAHDIILASMKAQKEGLKGVFAIDDRGIPQRKANGQVDGYGAYDTRLRDLVRLIKASGSIPLVVDDTPELMKAHSVENVALYCGWYSVRNYVPCCKFNPGAVGFHIASFELISLRNEGEKGWCRGLLNDNIAATLGAVDEPTLAGFPDPMEFFPLLLSGKLSLAEVYWLSAPTVSWKMSMIGDPLYKPFATKSMIDENALTPALRSLLPAGAPATSSSPRVDK